MKKKTGFLEDKLLQAHMLSRQILKSGVFWKLSFLVTGVEAQLT